MGYEFYVIEGKKLIDYKPKAEHYKRAYLKMVTNDSTFLNGTYTQCKDKMMKLIFVSVRRFSKGKSEEAIGTYEALQANLTFMYGIVDLMAHLTPEEFMRLFPIEKEYDGKRCGIKDYFSTMEEVRKYPLKKSIGLDRIEDFLAEYYNHDIMRFDVCRLCTISQLRRMEGQKGVMEEFMEEQGIHPKTYYRDGDYMVDSETGEYLEIQNPKNRMRKLFSVVE